MRTLPAPLVDEENLYDRLRTRRQPATADLLVQAKKTVLNAYSRYKVSNLGGLSTVIGDEATAQKLRSNYDVLRSGALVDDGAMILARSKICCLCGLRDSSELDHYLPKQLFPEFAAYTINLVPVCGVCNKQKGEQYTTTAGCPAFIHAYLNELPITERFLRATFKFDGAVLPSFQLVHTKGLSDELYRVLVSQFEYFGLGTDYSEEAVELLIEKHGAIEEYFVEGGAAAVEKYLCREAASVERRVGRNHWKPVVLTAAAESDDFCDWGFRLLDTHTFGGSSV